jgi:CRP-like cAMP-binding protein
MASVLKSTTDSAATNWILAGLPRPTYERLAPGLAPVRLSQGQVIYNPGQTVSHAYFITSGMISLVAITENGESVEVGTLGCEGLLGIPLVMGQGKMIYQAVVQISACGLRISADLLRAEFQRGGSLHDRLLAYAEFLHSEVTQSAICNRFHSLEERMCRWLLVTQQRVHSDELPLTQEFLAHMLGANRSTVTLTAIALQKLGLITYSRGHIKILAQGDLESAACDCYRHFMDEYKHFLVPRLN